MMTNRPGGRAIRHTTLVLATVFALLLPVAAFAAGGFDDVEDDNIFASDIQWMKDADITRGCNPPENTLFCPKDDVTREQMSAFMHRLAQNRVVDAATVAGLTVAELKGQQGVQGPAGATGADGDDGAFAVYERTFSDSYPAGGGAGVVYTVDAADELACDAGDFATGSWHWFSGAGYVTDNKISNNGTNAVMSFSARVSGGEGTVEIGLICADTTP